MLKRAATINRLLKDAKEKVSLRSFRIPSKSHINVNQSQVVKKPKAKRRAPTQEELLKRAQEIEEKNVIEHQDYLKAEDDKRKLAQVVRPVVQGRLIRWVSKVEEEIVHLTPLESPVSVASVSHTAQRYTIGPGQLPHWGPIPATPGSSSQSSHVGLSSYPQSSMFLYPHPPSQPNTPSTSTATRPLEPLPAVVQRKRKVANNYVVLENAQTEKAPRVTWKQTMEAMFGDHVRWEDVRVYSTKNRPMCKLFLTWSGKTGSYPSDVSTSKGEMPDYRDGRKLYGPANRYPIRKCLCVSGD